MSDIVPPDPNPARPEPACGEPVEPVERVRRMWVTWSRALAVAFLVAITLLGPLRKAVFPEPFSRVLDPRSHASPFEWEGADASRAAGAIFSLDASIIANAWGTRFDDADAFIGEVNLTCAVPPRVALVMRVTGNAFAPNLLRVRAVAADGSVLREWVHPGRDYGIEMGHWELSGAAELETTRVEVLMVDKQPGHGGWLGIGRILSPTGVHPALDPMLRPVLNVGFFLTHVFAVAGFLFLPGLALRMWGRFGAISIAALPLPGVALLAAGGAMIWIGGTAVDDFGIYYTIVHAGLAGAIIARRGPAFDPNDMQTARLFFALLAVVTAWSMVPLTAEREFFAGTNARGRMVASPPDSVIPFFTAAYFLRGRDGGADATRYFGVEWSVTSRGPLTAWMITTGLKAFGFAPMDPPQIATHAWPADREGFFVARIIGNFTNGLVVFGALAALAAFARGRREAIWFGLGWIAISPVVLINVAFLWPKMLASYFGLLAVAEAASRRRAWRVGAWLALAYLSHPVGILIAAPVFVWLGVIGSQGGAGLRGRANAFARGALPAGLWMIAVAAPWVVFKMIEGTPDVFLRYPLGDGRGYETAASFGTWLSCRWDNFWYSLVPGTLWHSNLLVQWAGGSLSWPGHWAMNCAKTVPFGVGLGLFPAVVWYLFRNVDPLVRLFRRWVIAAGILFMILIWGYNRDGLGRACLEPMVVFIMVATSSSIPRVGLIHRALACVVALEMAALLALAYLANPDFAIDQAWPSTWVLLGVTGAAWAVLAWLALSRPRSDEVDE
ncbi:MAG TPA: hypothetical protein VIK52_08225 [Opitutaceae bacterium]